MNNYQSALKYNRAKTYGWSLYKLGWCYYNLGKYRAALASWKKVVVISRTTSNEQAARLKEEAMREMVYAFAELGDIDGAIAYYRANGGTEYISQFLNLLADILSDQGKYNQAITTLKRFQHIDPNSPAGPDTQKQIVALASVFSDHRQMWLEL